MEKIYTASEKKIEIVEEILKVEKYWWWKK